MAVATCRSKDYHLLRLFEQRSFQDLNQERLFQVLWNQRELLTQIFHSLLKLIVSHLRITNFNYIKVRFIDELTEDKLFRK